MLLTAFHIIHIISVILWIGGLAFVTLVILPMMDKMSKPAEKAEFLKNMEQRFNPMAKIYSVIVVITGFGMLFHLDKQSTLFTQEGFLLTVMMCIGIAWVIFLFGFDKILKKKIEKIADTSNEVDLDEIFKQIRFIHWILLFISLFAVGEGILASHPDLFE